MKLTSDSGHRVIVVMANVEMFEEGESNNLIVHFKSGSTLTCREKFSSVFNNTNIIPAQINPNIRP